MIYDLMISELKDMDTSFVVGLELADEFVADVLDNESDERGFYHEYTNVEIEDILNNNEFFICSQVINADGGVDYFIEPLLHDGEQYIIGADCILIEDDLVDVFDYDKVECGEVYTLKIEDAEEDDFIEIAEDFFEYVEEGDDIVCDLANLLEVVYEIGVADGKEEIIEKLR